MSNDVISEEIDEQGRPLRRIRSFVRRQGRLTKGQQVALEKFWPAMGVDYQSTPLVFADLFCREAPVTLEIGFGMGTIRSVTIWASKSISRVSARVCSAPMNGLSII
jgi:tRNA (guanine-N7-)-methyltransferase